MVGRPAGLAPDGGQYRNLGRETFAVPVVWEDGWPVFSPETGHVEFSFPAPDLPECRWPEPPACDAFESPELALCWNFLRTSREPRYSLSARPGFLRLYARPETICEAASPSFLGRRQQHMCFSARTVMEFFPDSPDDRAGMTAFLNERYHLRAELCGGMLTLYRRSGGTDEILARVPCPAQKIWLKIETHFQQYGFFYALQPEEWRELGHRGRNHPLQGDRGRVHGRISGYLRVVRAAQYPKDTPISTGLNTDPSRNNMNKTAPGFRLRMRSAGAGDCA